MGIQTRTGLRSCRPRRRAEPDSPAHASRSSRDDGGATSKRRRGVLAPARIPHLVIATQILTDQLGTYPLVESQLDRFAYYATAIGYPDADVGDTDRPATRWTASSHRLAGRSALPRNGCRAQLATQMVVVDGRPWPRYAVALCRGSRNVAGVRALRREPPSGHLVGQDRSGARGARRAELRGARRREGGRRSTAWPTAS